MTVFNHTIEVTVPSVGIVSYTDIAENFSFTTEDPGGDGTASWDVIYFTTDDDEPVVPPLGARVTISDGAGSFYIGRVEEPSLEILDVEPGSVYGYRLHVVANGFGSSLDDQVYKFSKTWPAGTLVRNIFMEVLPQLCPSIFVLPSHVIGVSRSIPDESHDVLGESAQSIVNAYCTLGNPNLRPLTWGVRSVNNDPVFEAYERPLSSQFSYQVDIADLVSGGVAWPISGIRNSVLIKWNQGTWYVRDQTAITALANTERTIFIDASSQVGDLGTAQHIANTVLQTLKDIRAVGTTIEIDYAYGSSEGIPLIIKDVANLPVPPWRVRAGKNIKINNLAAPSASLPIDSLFIKSTNWNEEERRLTLSFEINLSLAQIIGKIIEDESKIPDKDAAGDSSGEGPSGDTDFAGVGGGNTATLDENGRLTASQLPEGWDLVSFNFAINGGTAAITEGQKGFIGVDYNANIHRVAVIGTDGENNPCYIRFKIWHTPSVPTSGDISVPGTYFLQDDGSNFFQLNNGKSQRWATQKMQIKAGEIWGVEVVDPGGAQVTTAKIGTIWLSGTRLTTGYPNITPSGPTISNFALGGAGVGVVECVWETDVLCNSQVQYGTSSDFTAPENNNWSVLVNKGDWSESGPSPKQQHLIQVSGIPSGVLMYFRAISVDVSGRKTTSAALTITL